MNNIVKSVVFAAVVLFAGIAAMQVIYKNQDATQQTGDVVPDMREGFTLPAEKPKEPINVCAEMYEQASKAHGECTYEALAKGDNDKLQQCNTALATFKRGVDEVCPLSD